MTTQKERWEQWTAPDTLEGCVKAYFEIMDIVETSDSGREFRPNHIDSCRVWDTHRLGRILPKMKELAMTFKTNPVHGGKIVDEQGRFIKDPLVDRNCGRLDGNCQCQQAKECIYDRRQKD